MFNKNVTVALAVLLAYSVICVQPALADTKSEKQAQLTQKVKGGIAKLGVGKDARVTVKLRDKTSLAGYISEAGADSFTVADPKTGKESPVAYADVTQVKGHHRSTGAKIAIGVGVGAAALVVFFIFWGINHFD